MIAAFIWWQGVFKHPLMPLYIWKDKNFSLVNKLLDLYRRPLTDYPQLVVTLCLGFLGFSGNAFWLCLYYQVVEDNTPLSIAARMVPMAISGILVNVIAGFIMHIISNKLLMSVGALAYCGCFALLSAMPKDGLYWAFAFPAICLSVVGADFQFTVTNVRIFFTLSLPLSVEVPTY